MNTITLDDCECCGERAEVEIYSVPTNGWLSGENLALTTAMWCARCADENKSLIISEEELRVMAGGKK